MKKDIEPLILGIIFFVIGIAGLFFPERIRERILKCYNAHHFIAAINPGLSWMKRNSSEHIRVLRVGGLIAIGASIFILYVLIYGK